jgi:hypothetical protein
MGAMQLNHFKQHTLSCIIFILSFYCHSCLAWGALGHRIIGLIAEHHLDSKSKMYWQHISQHQSLAQLSTWADDIKSTTKIGAANRNCWHYINLERNQHKPNWELVQAPNVFERLHYIVSILSHKGNTTNMPPLTALKWLVHLVGDAHQPFHAGYSDDHGGNHCKILWFGRLQNLHQLWDSSLLLQKSLSYTEYTAFLEPIPKSKIKLWQAASIATWLDESYTILPTLYPTSSYSYCNLSHEKHLNKKHLPQLQYAYNYKYEKIVAQRLQQAGIRLAGLLNQIAADNNYKHSLTNINLKFY